jgi:UDP-glucose 4-epimerase
MRIDVVTGGAGFIGSHMVDRLLSEGEGKVRVIDNLSNGNLRNLAHHEDNPRLEFIEADISDKAAIAGTLEDAGRVFHFAALADIVPSIERPEAYFRANVDGTFNLLEEARHAGVERFLYAASSTCYGIPDHYPTAEEAHIQPQYPYALTKHLGELLVLHWGQVYGISVLSLRMFNVFGPRARTSGTYGAVFGVFLAQVLAGEPLTIVGDGEQTRDFTFVTDVVDAFLTAAAAPFAGRAYNVGSRGTYSVNELVRLLGAKETVHIPKRPGEPDCTFADTTAIERDVKWRAQVPFADGVRVMLENIEHWRTAPVWTPKTIAGATESWFGYLGNSKS